MRISSLVSGAALLCAAASGASAAEVPSSADEIRPLLVGSAVPDVTLPAADGGEVDLLAAARTKPTVLIFYRGGW